MRRKCLSTVQPIPSRPFGPGHPVAHMIATGTPWFDAWGMQQCVPLAKLARASGLSRARLAEIAAGDGFSRGELEALAAAWRIAPDDLIASLPDPSPLLP